MPRPLLACLMFILMGIGGAVAAQNAPPMHAVPLAGGETLRLDGRLDHPAWQRAPVYERFVEVATESGGAPAQPTRVRLLFDERALYVGVEALDSEPDAIRDDLARADLVNRTQDFVVVYIDAIGARRSAQFFRVNAAGSTADGLHTAADDSEDFAPDFDWDAAAARHARGWTAVLRLPFASLRFAEGEQRWRIMVARRIPRRQFHLVASVPIPREATSFIATMQPLLGVQLPARHDFLIVRPSLTVARRRERDAGVVPRSDTGFDASLDVKWRPRAELVLDGTLNPDFSQVALDVPQLSGNTRFALELPEKRPFFFESADLLRAPTPAVYTRSFTEPRWGLRGTWRGTTLAGSAWLIDDRGGGIVQLPGAFGTGAAQQPGSRTLLARARSDAGALHWGGVAALRRYEDGRGDNAVAGPDLLWHAGEAWTVQAQALWSRSTALPAADGRLAAGGAVAGHRTYLHLRRHTEGSESTLFVDRSSAGFRHDSGFVAQAGVQKAELSHRAFWRPLGPFHEFTLGATARRVQQAGGGTLVEQTWFPTLSLQGAHNLEAWFEWHGFEHQRAQAGGPAMRPRYAVAGMVMSPASWFPLMEATVDVGRLADSVAQRTRGGARWKFVGTFRPLRRLELEPTLSRAWLREGGERRYDESLAQLLGIWHFSARSHLRAIVQRSRVERLAEAAVAAGRDADAAASLTWSWRHSAGSVLYVGASRERAGAAAPARRGEAFVKLQFDLDDATALRRALPGAGFGASMAPPDKPLPEERPWPRPFSTPNS